MNRTFKYALILLALLPVALRAQDGGLFHRLQAITENGIDYYNVDGVIITCQVTNVPLSKRNICQGLKINESDLKESNLITTAANFMFEKIDTLCSPVVQYNTNFIFENEKGHMTHIIYMSPYKRCTELQKTLTPLVLERKIPETVFNKSVFNTLNFAGRKIELGTYMCYWTAVNTVQWPYHGEMNWSVHKDSLDAAQCIDAQFHVSAHCRTKEMDVEIVSDRQVDVWFEGVAAKARKVVHKLKGESAELLECTNDGNTRSLIIYYVAAPVRGNWVSCTMSFWNNDFIEQQSGLPLLLEKVMQLK
jgi:hypothetical protein